MHLRKNLQKYISVYIGVLFLSMFSPMFVYVFAIVLLALSLDSTHSLLRRMLLSWFTYFGLLIAFYLAFGLLRINIPFRHFALIMPLLPLGLIFFTGRLPKVGTIISKSDIASLIAAGVTFVLLAIPIFTNNKQEFLLFLSSGEDNASHIAITNYNVIHQSFSYFKPTNETGLIRDLSIYQQGMHLNQAFVIRLLPSRGPLSLLYQYYILGIINYSVMIFMMSYLAIELAIRSNKKTPALIPVVYGLLPLTIFVFGFGIFLYLLGWGFYTQVTSYALLLITLYILDSYQQKKWTIENYLLLLLAVGAISNVWFFLLPIVSLPLLSVLKDWRRVWENKTLLALTVIAGLFAVLPIIINILLSTKKSPLNEPGGVYIMSGISILIGLFLTVLLWFLPKNNRSLLLSSLVTTASGAGLFVMFVWIYQRLTIGHNEYYFYKSVYTLFLLIFTIVAGIVFSKLARVLRKRKSLTVLAGASAIVWIFAIFLLKPVYTRVYLNNWFNGAIDLSDITVIENAALSRSKDVIFLGDCSVPSDYISNRWTGALLLTENFERSNFETRRITGRPEQELPALKNYLSKNPEATLRVTNTCLDPTTKETVIDQHIPVL